MLAWSLPYVVKKMRVTTRFFINCNSLSNQYSVLKTSQNLINFVLLDNYDHVED